MAYRRRWRRRTMRVMRRRTYKRRYYKRRIIRRRLRQNYFRKAIKIINRRRKYQQRAPFYRPLTLYNHPVVRTYYKPYIMRFNISDFNATSGSSTYGHWVQDIGFDWFMDQRDLDEAKDYAYWNILALTTTFHISRTDNFVKYTQTPNPPSGQQQPTQFPALENSNAFNFFVAFFKNARMQTECATLTTHETFTGNLPNNVPEVLANKQKLMMTGLYKRLNLKGNKQTFTWKTNKHAALGGVSWSTTSPPVLANKLETYFASVLEVGNTPHGIDFNFWDYNSWIDPASGQFKATFEVTAETTAVMKYYWRLPVV